jgi:mediator of replication checkpoint protein 1
MYRPSPSQRPYDTLMRSHSDGTLGAAPGPGTGPGTAASSPLVTRQPLSTLAEMSPMSSSVRREPLRRLRRAHTSPDGPVPTSASASPRQYGYPRGQSLSPSPSPSRAKAKGAAAAAGLERTAFAELMTGAAAHRDNVKAKKLSEFVQDQAIESDEEDMLGFGGVRKKKGVNDDDDDDDDDEHDADGVIKALVDDAQMDDAKLAKLKVLEKHL